MSKPDLEFHNAGSFVLMWPRTEAGHYWVQDNIADVDTIDRAGAVVIEHRYLADIVLGARRRGLVCEG